ncbi:toxin co-regulated pilus biosynthesis Q family protein [Acidovorax sp. SUPP950]|uniref:toxin co-regulated pilus biosynthesis Q family protein n=1 Tax=Acidovorax sp. SUPP950 TaxID=511901 RepID=UPI0023C300BC|nr:toxin co-regulated pilus biosynthesis Q family protein [Acidovorax sp. SUPP950]GKS73266.1 toxin co-regulated pilus biosynthesis Q family protein [Acidovorax sp. SUPP950]
MNLRASALAAASIALSCAATAAEPTETSQTRSALLASTIAITWNAPVDELGQLLAARLGVPYQRLCPPEPGKVVMLEQSGAATVSDALRTVNTQLQPAQSLTITPTAQGPRVELARATPQALQPVRSEEAGCDPAALQALDARSRTVVSVLLPSPGPGAGTPATAPAPKYVLRAGEPVHAELQRWAEAAGWKLIWYPQVSWEVISASAYSNDLDVSEAVEAVVKVLRSEGKQIALSVASANRLMEVTSMDITDRSDSDEE